MLGSSILDLKGTRTVMFQLSGFYCRICRGSFKGSFRGYTLNYSRIPSMV